MWYWRRIDNNKYLNTVNNRVQYFCPSFYYESYFVFTNVQIKDIRKILVRHVFWHFLSTRRLTALPLFSVQTTNAVLLTWRVNSARYICGAFQITSRQQSLRAKLHYTDTGYEHQLRTPPTDKLTTILQQICHIAMPEPNISTCQDVGMWQFFVRWYCLLVFVAGVRSRCPCSGVCHMLYNMSRCCGCYYTGFHDSTHWLLSCISGPAFSASPKGYLFVPVCQFVRPSVCQWVGLLKNCE